MTISSTVLFVILVVYVSSKSNETDDDCFCVNYFLCKASYIITDGENILDRRGLNRECPKIRSEKAGRPERSVATSRQGCNDIEECCKLKNQTTSARTVPIVPTVPIKTETPSNLQRCGFRSSEGISYQNTSNTSGFGEFPWTVAILNCNRDYQCVGSLIHPSVVLTAAQCVSDNATYTVIAGASDVQESTPERQERAVSSIKIHENFKFSTLANDIALLFLEKPFNLNSYLNLTCLPSLYTVDDTSRCFATGWGKDGYSHGNYSQYIKKVEVPMVPKDTCQEKLRKTRLGRFFQLHDSFVCAGGEEGKDVCTGDGGAPLVCPIPGKEDQCQQLGIASWGIYCKTEDVPGVYTSVSFFRSWIDQEMKANNYDPSE